MKGEIDYDINPTGLPVGEYNATVTLQAPGFANQVDQIQLSVTGGGTTTAVVITLPQISGLTVIIDGATYTSSQTFLWIVGSVHSISVPPVSGMTFRVTSADGSVSGNPVQLTVSSITITLAVVQAPAGGTTQSYIINTVAGGVPPLTPVSGVQVSIGQPGGVAVDSAGNVYFTGGLCVFKLDSSGVMTLVAGNSHIGYSGDGEPATSAQFYFATGVAVDASGNVYIADSINSRIRKVSTTGIITTVAGNGSQGFSGDGAAATSAQLLDSSGVALDASGNLYIADQGNARIRKVSANGIITTVAGNGSPGYSGDGGPATGAQLASPISLAVDAIGNLYIADQANARIRKVSTNGIITTVAGNGSPGYSGDGGPATSAQLNLADFVAVDGRGNLYIADSGNNRIRKVSPTGIITTVAGSGFPGQGGGGYSGDGGPATSAQLYYPLGVALDVSGNLYIADLGNARIRKVSATGIITTVAGNGFNSYSGDGGPARSAQLNSPSGVAVDVGGDLYIADQRNNRIRKVSTTGVITTVVGGASFSLGDGGPATSARLSYPWSVAIDAGGNLYIGDTSDQRVRKVTPAGIITTVAGGGSALGDGGPATNAQLSSPEGVAVDAGGNFYIADSVDNRIRKVSASGTITTVAGNGSPGYSGDGGAAASAQLNGPRGVAVDGSGNLYIADTGNNRIRKISAVGIINTVAGGGTSGTEAGPATSAGLIEPYGVTLDTIGNVYIAESFHIRKLSPNGIITTIAGSGLNGYSGDGGPATNAQLSGPFGVAVDASGGVYIAEYENNAIRLLTPSSSTCTYSVSSTSIQSLVAGGSLPLGITTSAGCAWSVSNLPDWITVSGAAAGSGTASVTLVVAPNSGAPRSAQVSVAGLTVTVSQQAANGCTYTLSSGGQAFLAAGGTGTITITAGQGCAWSVTNSLPWVSITGASSGTGNGTVTYQVLANTGGDRSGTLTIAGLSFMIQQSSTSIAGLSTIGTMAHLASGGTWKTTITLVNAGTTAAVARLNFFDDNGNPLTLPLDFPQSPSSTGPLLASTLDQMLNPGALLIIEITGPVTATPLVGWAQLQSNGSISGFATFRQQTASSDQQAAVPLETRNAGAYLLPFDNTNGFVTGVALASTGSSGGNVGITIRDDTGAVMLSTTLAVATMGHMSFVLSSNYGLTAGRRGTVEFESPPGGQIAVLGIQYHTVTGAFSSIPSVAK